MKNESDSANPNAVPDADAQAAQAYSRFLHGEKEALVDIIRQYKDGLTFFLLGFVKDPGTAEELTQETFLRLYVKKPKYAGKSGFKTWLYAIGRNIARDYLRKASAAAVEALDEGTLLLPSAMTCESAYFAREKAEVLFTALRRLKPDYYRILWLVYFENMSVAQCAKIMKKRPNNISVLLYRAKKSLKEELIKEGLTDESL